jgi:N-acetylmuramoyl-L-alanine amidase
VCDAATWNTLVEAGFRLGDRFLYLRSPMVRGDDVAELQQRLGALGFDTGRVDGIFGTSTAAALAEFQRNAGQPVDAIVGAATLRELRRVQARHERPEVVSSVRAREELRQSPPTLVGRHIAIGETGGIGAALGALRRQLNASGARVTELHHPDESVQAQAANAGGVDLYLGLRLDLEVAGCSAAYYSGYRFESAGGRGLAELVQLHVPPALGIEPRGVRGMSIPILRETKMPAVLIEVGPPSLVVEQGPVLANALLRALGDWTLSHRD